MVKGRGTIHRQSAFVLENEIFPVASAELLWDQGDRVSDVRITDPMIEPLPRRAAFSFSVLCAAESLR
jgi:hypothetical protein